jgi:hypothetical protein
MARTRNHRGGAAVGGLTRRKKSRYGGSRKRCKRGGQFQGVQTGVSNVASGVGSAVGSVGSGIGSAANSVTGFFSGMWDKTKKAVSGSTMGGRRRRRRGGMHNVVGYSGQFGSNAATVGGRRRRKR